ncbi:hypothetical protein JC796_03675 [Delftia acidovorans]|uniref:hypothetical protein n=1 Tax=Delftia acidovorans TaxID=80866 RepID=UPI0018E87D7E|nr:hypothetical protein [Delftia acidovorans]MBJ2139820.1 hypothetical protein [Delftia acidovorans]
MAIIELIFRRPLAGGSPNELVFGNEDDSGSGQDAVTRAAIRLPGARVGIRALRRKTAATAIRLPGARVALGAIYQTRTDRPAVGGTLSAFEEGAAARGALVSVYQQSAVASSTTRIGGGRAFAAGAATVHRWQDSQRLRLDTRQGMGNALAVAGITAQAWQEAIRVHLATRQGMDNAQAAQAAVLQRFQEAIRVRRATVQAFSDGLQRGAWHTSSMGDALQLAVVMGGARYQDAMVPPSGITPGRPVDPPKPPPCYVPPPGGAVELVFSQAWTGSTELVFICCKGGVNPEPPRYVIPKLKVYMTVHTMEAALLPSMEPVVLRDVVIASEDDGFGWSFSANGPEHLLDQLAPSGGLPARVRVVVDGIDFVFAVQSLSRSRRFGEHSVSVQGASVTALLGSPMPESTWLSTQPATAQQLILNALEFTGVGIDWRVNDWLVPAGAWSHRGTPLSAVMRVAESIGAVVRSHRTQEQLIIAPRYPALPWHWAATTPDVRMPADVIVTDDLSPEPRASYNAVYVVGQIGGIQGHVRRAASAGDVLAPDVTDALITDAVAARQRGEAILGAAGNKLMQSITMPLITGGASPGLILPGQLIEVDDTKQTWRGLVRASRLSASMPVVRQQITVEREAA